MAEVIFERTQITDIPNPRPGEQQNVGAFELITGIHALKMDVSMDWHAVDQYAGEQRTPLRQTMPAKMAQKLMSFCVTTKLSGNYEFDCHSFVCYMLDWQNDLSPAGPHVLRTPETLRQLLPAPFQTNHTEP